MAVRRKRWANIRSSVGFALTRYCGAAEQHWESRRELQGPWRELRDRISTDLDICVPLSRLFRYCALHGIAPDQVSAATFAAFRIWLEQRTTVIDPAGRFRRTCLAWNQAAAAVPGWPPARAPIDARRTRQYATPEALPASFQAEIEKWRAVLAGDDLFAENAPKRPLRPASIEHMVGTVHRFAAGMIQQGVPAAELRAMADLFTPAHFQLGLRFQLARHGGEPSPGITQMTDILLPVARKWVRVDPTQYEVLQRHAKSIECRPNGLTPTNERRLAQFDDPGNLRELLDLPGKLLELARRRRQADREGALLVQMAVAILILLFTAIRLRNLAGCHVERNIVRNGAGRGQPTRLQFEREEVKSKRMLSKPIPDVLARLLDLYLQRYRPLLSAPSTAAGCFPAAAERPKAKEALGRQITKTIRQHTGLVVNVHLFRHLSAKLWDLDDPGNIEGIRLHLDHVSSDTTRDFYSGFASDRAARRFHEQVLGRMSSKKGPKSKTLSEGKKSTKEHRKGKIDAKDEKEPQS